MTRYAAPLADLRFALYDVLDIERTLGALSGGEATTRDVADAILDEAARFCEQVLAPINASGDLEGCRFDAASASVATPSGFREAYARYVENGWPALTAPVEFGGQDVPLVIGAAVKEMLDSANLAWGNYPLLSHGAVEALLRHGEGWQREAFLKPLIEGRWTGTMCLTEPHCGTDLGLLKVKAEPVGDGSYRISGTKIFITAGEHDFAENIVHLVLARLPDAPAGVKGISLFVVPKFKVGRDGALGERNALACGAIEHKMGIKGSATCTMNFDGAIGTLVGEANKGLAAMFTMMNTARLAVGLQGLGLIERAFQNSLAYARDRVQMRAAGGAKFPEKPADPIIVHADVRRMLLTQKAIAEGGRVLALYAYLHEDVARRSDEAPTRERADALVSFLTPIVKGLLTETANECTYDALQIFGGHGYIVDNGMEQLARDARITTLYEGTTQIQALDLLGRKVLQQKGVGLKHFLIEIGEFCARHASEPALAEFIAPLAVAAKEWSDITLDIARRAGANADEAAAAAYDYLFYSGYVALAYCWARSVAVADAHASAVRDAKRQTARFYFARVLPRIATHAAAIRAGASSVVDMPDALFG
jgi:alkylation response protein AidB-like acyl-CoA dehydrogenase